jgi:hypothetical protein
MRLSLDHPELGDLAAPLFSTLNVTRPDVVRPWPQPASVSVKAIDLAPFSSLGRRARRASRRRSRYEEADRGQRSGRALTPWCLSAEAGRQARAGGQRT